MWRASRSYWRGKQVWVIGATSGIGRAIALELAEAGAVVVASGRNRDALEELTAIASGISPLKVDVASAADWYQAETDVPKDLDVLIYSAGSWTPVDLTQWDYVAFEEQLTVNFLGMARAVGLVLPRMIARNAGVIAGLSSASGYVPLPRAEAYGSSKAAVLYFLEALRIDLRHTAVKVVSVSPGFVATPLTAKNDFAMPFMQSTDQAVQSIIGGIERGAAEIHFPKRLTLPLKLIASLPRFLAEWLIGVALKRDR